MTMTMLSRELAVMKLKIIRMGRGHGWAVICVCYRKQCDSLMI